MRRHKLRRAIVNRDGWCVVDPAGRTVRHDLDRDTAREDYVRTCGDGRTWGWLVANGYRLVEGGPPDRSDD
ncbi:hypothetical protein EDC65_2225 [Stella humosa]|uniref:Uncharacterized protein n=1 Tax=Stella humosa TaxID=94 RepID=A0A3N1MGY0_9PROT|nr:hypothetical protein [Stella humosa]ROQ00426.1 hypothetical protein EDC65_2225 [Stella humosa]BBK30331.1 hypothetical protein STHU_09650 [Stella humosa]